MKIRTGFVSNSSSSSFVVMAKEIFKAKPRNLLLANQIKKLEKFGFWQSTSSFPQHVDINDRDKRIKDFHSYDYSVICNQDEVIEFLIKNKIPFVASIHYNHYIWKYEPKKKRVIIVPNFGEMFSLYAGTVAGELDNIGRLPKFEVLSEDYVLKKYAY